MSAEAGLTGTSLDREMNDPDRCEGAAESPRSRALTEAIEAADAHEAYCDGGWFPAQPVKVEIELLRCWYCGAGADASIAITGEAPHPVCGECEESIARGNKATADYIRWREGQS